MELGCAGVLLNTALSEATYPVVMAQAMKAAVVSGRLAYHAGRMPQRGLNGRDVASASSPKEGLLSQAAKA